MELINKFRCQFIEKKGGEANHKLLQPWKRGKIQTHKIRNDKGEISTKIEEFFKTRNYFLQRWVNKFENFKVVVTS